MAPRALALPLCLAALWLAPATHAVNITQGLRGATKLPSFIPRCSYKDPKIGECVLVSANKVIPKIAEGYPSLGLPSLDPLVIDEINIETGYHSSSFKLYARNIVITGLAKTTMIDITMDDNTHISLYNVPRLQIVADYEVDGNILVLPIKGNGRTNITFENSTIRYVQPFRNVKKADGKFYYDFLQARGSFNISQAYFQLDNLFNGDKVLGEQINSFLNENWREVIADFGQPFTDAALEVIYQFLSVLTSTVTLDEIYLDFD